MIQITIITLICCLLFGVPIAFAIGIAGTAGLYFGSTAPMFMVVKQFFEGINSFSYMAIPLFILAGAIMGKGGISKRIVNFASAILSWLRGGTAITTVGASMIFAAVSGSGAATISAIGGITVPEMLKKGYSRGFTAAMSAGAGSLGPIVPPSVDMIVFGCITGFSISRLFVGGIIPGFIIGLSLMIYCYIYAKKRNIDYGGKFRGKVVWAAFKDSIWALLMPIIIIGGVMGGAFTATEAGAVACVYGLIVSVFVYKSMSFKDLINVLRSASVNMAKLAYIVNVVIDESKKTVAAFAGNYVTAHRTGCDFLLGYCRVKAQIADIVITSNGGAPLDQNLYQCVKGMTAAEASCRSGGTIIMCAECADGHGGEGFYKALRDCKSPAELYARQMATPQDKTAPDQWESQILARILMHHKVIVVSRPEMQKTIEDMKMQYAPNLDAALKAARYGSSKTLTVIPNGISVIIVNQ